MRTLSVLCVGQPVTIGGGITALISAVLIRSDHVSYEVAWWDGRMRKAEWFPRDQIDPIRANETLNVRCGFADP